MLDELKNRKKPIIGAIASAVTYVAAKVGLDLDPELSAVIAGLVFTAAVERLHPIFGETRETPKVAR